MNDLKELYEYFKTLGVFNSFQIASIEGQLKLCDLLEGHDKFVFERQISKYIYTQ